MNPMQNIVLEKITLNIGAGEAGPKLDNSKKMLEKISGKKVVITTTKKRTTFGPGGKAIGAKTTLRGKEAKDLLVTLLKANDNKIKSSQFDKSGSFSFGVHEYINIPGMKYDPDVGIIGLEVAVTLGRPGFRVKRKIMKPGKIGKKQKITAEEAKEFAKKEFGVVIE